MTKQKRQSSDKPDNAWILTQGKRISSKKQKQKQKQVAEIKWDSDVRRDYLTGFQKRKQQRKKKAQEKAVEREKQERRQQRQLKRDAERELLEEHANIFQSFPKQQDAENEGTIEGEDEEEEEEEECVKFKPLSAEEKKYLTKSTVTTVITASAEDLLQ